MLLGKTLYGTSEGDGGDGVFGTVFAINTDGSAFTNLHYFTSGTNGAYPFAGLTASGDTLYGTHQAGGTGFSGAVFSLSTNGADFTQLFSFTGGTDGFYPRGGVIIASNRLYGTVNGLYGAVFAVNADGTGFTNLHSFTPTSGGVSSGTNEDGANPQAGVVLSNGKLYGTTPFGGSYGYGVVFAVNTDGTEFTNLHNFSGGSEGAYPVGGVIISSNILYGATAAGGTNDLGTLFSLSSSNGLFSTLHQFEAADGTSPVSSLVLAGGTLYGTAESGGSYEAGSIFAMTIDGMVFTNLHSFSWGEDGAVPTGGLILSGHTLYGTTFGIPGEGTVFSLSLPVPELTISVVGTNITLTWPVNVGGCDCSDFSLVSSTQLDETAIWEPVLTLPIQSDGQNEVACPVSDVQKYYRLSKALVGQ